MYPQFVNSYKYYIIEKSLKEVKDKFMKKLYFKEKFFKITDHYPILDENGREAYYLDQDFTLIGYKSAVSDKNGNTILNIDREILAFFPRYTVSFADGSSMVIQQKLEFFKHRVHVYMDDETLDLVGNIFHYDFDIKNGAGQNIGAVRRKIFTLTDSYELTIIDEKYTEELMALVICLNNMIDREQASAASSAN